MQPASLVLLRMWIYEQDCKRESTGTTEKESLGDTWTPEPTRLHPAKGDLPLLVGSGNLNDTTYTSKNTQDKRHRLHGLVLGGEPPTKTLHICSAFFILQVEIESCKKKAAESSLCLFTVPDRLLLYFFCSRCSGFVQVFVSTKCLLFAWSLSFL